MPYKLRKAPSENKYFVETEATGHKHSKAPLTKSKATRQMRALYLHGGGFTHDAGRPGIIHGMTRLEQTGNPLRPEQHFKNLYDASAVVTQFPNQR